jgi:geranylgeranyl diphosphate synthase, type II
MRSVDELRELVEDALAELSPVGPPGLDEAVRYALEGGGKRIRPVLCLAVGEAVGSEPEDVLPAACAVELVHSFSLVHDDLPALDDDETRRGRPSTWAQFGESVAVLAGDALLVEAFRLALSYETPAVARELAAATLGMIGGQYLDVTGSADDLAALNRLKTGRLFEAVDDLLDGDGHVLAHGEDETRRRADEAAERALAALAELDADTSVLRGIVDGLATRTA